MNDTEMRKAAKSDVAEIDRKIVESGQKVADAADWILGISGQLRLTWDEFDRAVALVKKRAHISQT